MHSAYFLASQVQPLLKQWQDFKMKILTINHMPIYSVDTVTNE